jgi:hypothetical protein
MSEAVLDEAIEQIADGLTVDWTAIDRGTPGRAREWAKSLRVLNDIVKLHRDAAADYDQTTMAATATPDVAPSPTPDTWGKYRLTNKVGEGSYGSVYRAWDSELERDVAIKILHRRVGDTKLRERLLQEGRALARIQHNNVVRVLGIEAHGDRVGLCMEFVRGKTLADIVHGQGRLSAAEAVLIGEDLCRALSAVHRSGFIHRDVKAKNVMRDDTGRIVLMDFGTGRSSEALNKNDRAGTPLYMAPEVIEDGQQSVRSDVYSLGVLLFYLVTGEYPVSARTIDELRAAHGRREHRWLSEVRPDLPVGFMQVVERTIALDPEDRYASASELLDALSKLRFDSSPRLWKLAMPAVVIAGIFSGIVFVGALTSTVFDIALQRVGFVDETLWDYVVWGRRASFTPVAMAVFVLLCVAALQVTRRLLLTASARARRIDEAIRRGLGRVVHDMRLSEASVAASYALLVSGLALVAAVWYFAPLILTVMTVPSASVDDLTMLSPEFTEYHNRYRQVFIFVLIGSIGLWYPVLRLAQKGQVVRTTLWIGGLVVCSITLSVLQFPYRTLYASLNEPFERVAWRGERCYVIGQRAGDLLLFCPALGPPHNRIAKRNDSDVMRLGVRESLFSRAK